jgi:hypothetical protein
MPKAKEKIIKYLISMPKVVMLLGCEQHENDFKNEPQINRT